MLNFLIGILATFRITSLFVSEAGPFDVFSKLRDAAGVVYDDRSQPQGANEVAKALTCVWCASVYAGGAIALLQGYRGRQMVLRALAYSAGAIVIDRWMDKC